MPYFPAQTLSVTIHMFTVDICVDAPAQGLCYSEIALHVTLRMVLGGPALYSARLNTLGEQRNSNPMWQILMYCRSCSPLRVACKCRVLRSPSFKVRSTEKVCQTGHADQHVRSQP